MSHTLKSTTALTLPVLVAVFVVADMGRADTGSGDSPLFAIDTAVRSWDDSPLFTLDTATPVAVGPASTRVLRRFSAIPNPFNPVTTLRFELTSTTTVSLSIHDTRGRLVRQLLSSRPMESGVQEVPWEGCDDSGRRLASGIYRCRLVAGGEQRSLPVALIK